MARALIVGATSAIAAETARLLAQRGDELLLAARDEARLQLMAQDLLVQGARHVETIAFDALAATDYVGLTGRCWGDGLDLLLLAHGTLPAQEAVQDDPAATEQALQVNANSAIGVLAAFAPLFEARGQGAIVVISSVAGDRGRKSNYVYGAAKAALSAYSQGLRNRLFSSGVSVITIKPGFVDTPMTADFPKGALWAQPRQIAAGILRAVERGSDVVYLPGFWRLIMMIIRAIPEKVFKRLSL